MTVTRTPEGETRAESIGSLKGKAQRLVDKGQVRNPVVSEYRTTALVWDGYVCYHPSIYPNGDYWCECAWARHHAHTDDLCAHALALRLTIEKENQSCQP